MKITTKTAKSSEVGLIILFVTKRKSAGILLLIIKGGTVVDKKWRTYFPYRLNSPQSHDWIPAVEKKCRKVKSFS